MITSLPFSDSVGIAEATIESGEPTSTYYNGKSDGLVDVHRLGVCHLSIHDDSDYRRRPILVSTEQNGSGLRRPRRVARLYSWTAVGTTFTSTLARRTTFRVEMSWRYGWFTHTCTLAIEHRRATRERRFRGCDRFQRRSPFHGSARLDRREPGDGRADFVRRWVHADDVVRVHAVETGSYGAFGVSNVAVYTGRLLRMLTNVACADWPGLYFHADAGTTYYLQVYGGSVSVDVVPPPAADFIWSPGDPSGLRRGAVLVRNGGYWDPTVTGYSWTFGDGATGTGSPAPHSTRRTATTPSRSPSRHAAAAPTPPPRRFRCERTTWRSCRSSHRARLRSGRQA